MAFKQLLGPVSTLTCHLPRQVVRAMHSTAPLLLPPDLYEGSREDRNVSMWCNVHVELGGLARWAGTAFMTHHPDAPCTALPIKC